jgi:Region found in RelA / SpoT proteins
MQPSEQMHDILAVRIIVPNKTACYEAMRALTARWPQRESRFKDYVRHPKANGYQSLHTVVVSDAGVPIELQLRTPAMHWNAEFGVAAHWRYKEAHRSGAGDGGAAAAAQEHAVAWSRMVLAYGMGVREWRKSRAGPSHLRRSATLTSLTQSLMATTAPGEEVPAHGGRAACCATGRSFLEYVARSLLQPLRSIYIVVSSGRGARIDALDAASAGGATVGALLATSAVLSDVGVEQIVVNGIPAWGQHQRLVMGDVVEVAPGTPAPALSMLERGAAQWHTLRRELYGLLAEAMRPEAALEDVRALQ